MGANGPTAADLPAYNVSKHPRLVRDSPAAGEVRGGAKRNFALKPGEMYRISYAIGGSTQRRVSRSVATFGGESERRDWAGDTVSCLDFSLPHGRTLSLVSDQLVDVRAAELNDRGQCVLADEPIGARRRGGRRS